MEFSPSEQLAIAMLNSQPELMEALADFKTKQVQLDDVYSFFDNLVLGLKTSKLIRRGSITDADIL